VINIIQKKLNKNIGSLIIGLSIITLLFTTFFSGCVQQQEGFSIVLIGRDSTSGTRDFFWQNVMHKENFSQLLLEKSSNGAVQQTVAQTPGAIGYVGLGYIDATVKALTLENITANVTNVLSKQYPLSRDLYMFTKGNATRIAKEFITYIQSTEGQIIVQEEGFVPLTNHTFYDSSGKTLSGTITVSGSTTVLPIATKAATNFSKIFPSVTVTVSGGGSGVGISAVSQGTVDIGMSSRELTTSENNLGLARYTISHDGIAIIVNSSNNYINNITLAQLKAIYKGEITNWKNI
jgi:phosphate transport system substrate-binding protein